jgi:nitrous-oxide reductase
MRVLRHIAVFSPESWQGYGFGDQSNKVLASGNRHNREISWGDSHHPALSETKGEYDGQFLFINDKANPRIAVVDLKDMVTRQHVTSQLIENEHGAAFVTPNTEYVIEGTQYPAPLGGRYEPIEKFDTDYRGAVIFWKSDRTQGRIVPEQSFAIELPPYMQDLADAGKLDSDGWAFLNSFDTERAYGGNMEGRPALESGASKNDMDYLHVINWRKGEQVAQTPGKTTTIAGMKVISLKTATDEGLLYFVPEPKSPHGCDVTPDGKDIVVGGKLDTHATVFSFAKIKALIDGKKFESKDLYGVPILPFNESIRGQCDLGLGPLHTQFDDKGNAYTSMFLESAVAKWSVKGSRGRAVSNETSSRGVAMGRTSCTRETRSSRTTGTCGTRWACSSCTAAPSASRGTCSAVRSAPEAWGSASRSRETSSRVATTSSRTPSASTSTRHRSTPSTSTRSSGTSFASTGPQSSSTRARRARDSTKTASATTASRCASTAAATR